MARILSFMFMAFIMILVIMAVSKLLDKWSNKPSKEENRESFMNDLDKLAEKIKNK